MAAAITIVGISMKKFTKSLLMAVVLAGSTAFAHAADFERASTLNLVDGTAGFGPVVEFDAGNLNKTFADTFSFSIKGANNLDSNISAVSFDETPGLKFSHFDLYKTGSSTALFSGYQYPDTDLWVLTIPTLAAGDYFLKVEGEIKTASSITYSGNVLVSPVPEADAYAMLIAGLGLVGFMARRRKSAVAA